MFMTIIAAAMAAATPAPSITLPQPLVVEVCTRAYIDEQKSAQAGGPPISLVVPDVEQLLNLDAVQSASLEQSCAMFRNGAMLVTTLSTGKSVYSKATTERDEGLAPDHSGDPAAKQR